MDLHNATDDLVENRKMTVCVFPDLRSNGRYHDQHMIETLTLSQLQQTKPLLEHIIHIMPLNDALECAKGARENSRSRLDRQTSRSTAMQPNHSLGSTLRREIKHVDEAILLRSTRVRHCFTPTTCSVLGKLTLRTVKSPNGSESRT
jgi:hypothetical protein